jgi:hypothetical protein
VDSCDKDGKHQQSREATEPAGREDLQAVNQTRRLYQPLQKVSTERVSDFGSRMSFREPPSPQSRAYNRSVMSRLPSSKEQP